jgi:bifunctional non-homologous end joining protein LigD
VREVNDRSAKQRWIYVEDLAGLLGLVQMSALEYHAWGCTVADLARADRVVMDLDPGPGVAWRQVIETALALRERLAARRLTSFVRTTGGKGLHVVIPLRPAAKWAAVSAFARGVAEDLVLMKPATYVAEASKAKRPGKIFVDYLRNARGSTAVCSYSLRNRPGAPIATPLHWEELPEVRAGDQFRNSNIGKRLAQLPADPWADIDRIEQRLPDGD